MAAAQSPPIPVLAYYYIWFNPTSWKRAKIDYPLLGRYSSDDEVVMAKHIQMAQEAGINGFLVSWKRTPQLNKRLASLAEAASATGFRLGIVYQGLDFSRNPVPIAQVVEDLDWLATTYGRALHIPVHRRAAGGDLDRHREVLDEGHRPGRAGGARAAAPAGIGQVRRGLQADRTVGGRGRLLLVVGQARHEGLSGEAAGHGQGRARRRWPVDPAVRPGVRRPPRGWGQRGAP